MKKLTLPTNALNNIKVVFRFFSIFLVLYFITTSFEFEPLKQLVAIISYFFVSIIQPQATLVGTSIFFSGFEFIIIQLCTGVVSLSIFTALIFTYPSTIKEKLLSFTFFPIIFLFNTLRISIVILSSVFFKKHTILFLHEQTWILTAFFVLFCWYLFLNKTNKLIKTKK